jgi:hypothetical protein
VTERFRSSTGRRKGKRRLVVPQAPPLYSIKVNRTSLDHLLLGKKADVDKMSNGESIALGREVVKNSFVGNTKRGKAIELHVYSLVP